jgi:hypothetical protein
VGRAGERSLVAEEREGEMNGLDLTEENFEFEFFNFAPSLIHPKEAFLHSKFL